MKPNCTLCQRELNQQNRAKRKNDTFRNQCKECLRDRQRRFYKKRAQNVCNTTPHVVYPTPESRSPVFIPILAKVKNVIRSFKDYFKGVNNDF